MGKIKAICSYDLCDKQGEIQELDEILEECPCCHQGGDTWEIIKSKPKFSWKWLVALLVLAAIVAYFVWPEDYTLKLAGSHERTIKCGETDTLHVTINEGDFVVWKVTNGDDFVSVDSTGVVTALKEGENAVVVSSLKGNPEVKDSCVYNVLPTEVVPPVKVDEEKDTTSGNTSKVHEPEIQLSLNKSSLTIEVSKSATLVASVQPSKFASEVIWSSEPSSIASVSSKGVVTGKSKGTAIVTAKVKDKEVKVEVTVVGITPPPPSPCLDLGYAEYCGPTKVVSGKRVPHGLGGDLGFKRNYGIDLKKASGEIVSVKKGDRMRNCKFDNGRLVQGLIVFSNGEQRWITIGS